MRLTTLERPAAQMPQRNPVPSPPRQPNSVEEAARRALLDSGRGPLRQVVCRVSGSTARLTGRLPSFFLKQMAQEIIRRVDGIHQVDNQVDVTIDEEP